MNEQQDEKYLLEILKRFKTSVPLREVYDFSITPLDRFDVPLWCVALWTEDGVYYDGFGYGAGATRAARRVGRDFGELFRGRFRQKSSARRRLFRRIKSEQSKRG